MSVMFTTAGDWNNMVNGQQNFWFGLTAAKTSVSIASLHRAPFLLSKRTTVPTFLRAAVLLSYRIFFFMCAVVFLYGFGSDFWMLCKVFFIPLYNPLLITSIVIPCVFLALGPCRLSGSWFSYFRWLVSVHSAASCVDLLSVSLLVQPIRFSLAHFITNIRKMPSLLRTFNVAQSGCFDNSSVFSGVFLTTLLCLYRHTCLAVSFQTIRITVCLREIVRQFERFASGTTLISKFIIKKFCTHEYHYSTWFDGHGLIGA